MPFGRGKKDPVAGLINARVLDLILSYQKEFIDDLIAIVPDVVEIYLETLSDEEVLNYEIDVSELEQFLATAIGKQLQLNRLTANRLFYGIGNASAETIRRVKKFKKEAKVSLKEEEHKNKTVKSTKKR